MALSERRKAARVEGAETHRSRTKKLDLARGDKPELFRLAKRPSARP